MNIQRELIYAQRNHLINQDQDLTDTIEQVLDDYIDIALVEEDLSEKEKLYHFILKNISFHIEKIPDDLDIDDVEAVAELIYQFAYREIDDKKKQLDTIDLLDISNVYHFLRLLMIIGLNRLTIYNNSNKLLGVIRLVRRIQLLNIIRKHLQVLKP